MREAGLILLAAAVSSAAQSQSSRFQLPADRNWSATLSEDAQALHDDVVANHPGAVNLQDPAFAKRNDAQLKRALKRARTARTYEQAAALHR